MVARQYRLDLHDAEDLESDLWLKVLAPQGLLLRRYRGDASFQSYLTSVARNLVRDRRNKEWGKWRPSTAAVRRGPEAVALERLIRRDGQTFDHALEQLQRAGHSSPPRALHDVVACFPTRRRRRLVALETIGERPSPDSTAFASSQRFDSARRSSTVRRALRVSLQALAKEDRDLVVMRFVCGMTVGEISMRVGGEAKRMYRRLAKVLGTLRQLLLANGVDWPLVATLLADCESGVEIDLDVLSPSPVASPGRKAS